MKPIYYLLANHWDDETVAVFTTWDKADAFRTNNGEYSSWTIEEVAFHG